MKLRYLNIILFYLVIGIAALVLALLGGIIALFPGDLLLHRVLQQWSKIFICLGRLLLGIDYTLVGLERLPKTPCLVIVNHQSMWETLFVHALLPPTAFVLKRSLLHIPVFGWGLRLLAPIAINRKDRKSAVEQILQQGKYKLIDQQKWVVIFPESTRVPPKTLGRFSTTAAMFAIEANVPIVPIAHNAGDFWPKGYVPKSSGTILVTIGEVIMPQGDPVALTKKIRDWFGITLGF